MDRKTTGRAPIAALMVSALGVVFGDIGTSPLYALKECFEGKHGVVPTEGNVLGVLALIFWSLILIVSIKYLGAVMRADNRGEGGILALLALAVPDRADKLPRRRALLVALAVFGATLLYGDGIITPAISVLSAVEGLGVATPHLKDFVLPITIAVLIALFSVQHHGTGKMGRVFGPIMLVWFVCLAALGIKGILTAPRVLGALNPWAAVQFFAENGWKGFVVIGAVFLAVTGGEALYADMGHFGVRPIRRGWFRIVLPALFLNYLGQGALLLNNPGAKENPFYLLAPGWALYPLVVLATAATVIASQAVISGAFSLTMQAIQLGYLPRMKIIHTSSEERGQIYMPHINWMLMVACIGLVLGFGSSTNLAAAYGIAVTLTMLIDTILFFVAAQRLWNWSPVRAGALCALFFVVELAFLSANALKIVHGGWFPLVVGAGIFAIMATWKTGRRLVWETLQNSSLPRDLFFESIEHHAPQRIPGTAVFLAGNPNGTPLALLHNLKHNKVLHERNILLTLVTEDIPYVPAGQRAEVEALPAGFQRVLARYGFMEEPNVRELLATAPLIGGPVEVQKTTFFLSRETILPSGKKGMRLWRKWLFAVLSRNAQPATDFFKLPPNRVVELGMQVEL